MALLIVIFVSIHLLELAGYIIYVQDKKNNKMENMISDQEVYMEQISGIIRNGRHRLDELDQIGAFKSDDELGIFFNNLKAIQEVLDGFVRTRTNAK